MLIIHSHVCSTTSEPKPAIQVYQSYSLYFTILSPRSEISIKNRLLDNRKTSLIPDIDQGTALNYERCSTWKMSFKRWNTCKMSFRRWNTCKLSLRPCFLPTGAWDWCQCIISCIALSIYYWAHIDVCAITGLPWYSANSAIKPPFSHLRTISAQCRHKVDTMSEAAGTRIDTLIPSWLLKLLILTYIHLPIEIIENSS